MALKEQLMADFKEAMKAHDEVAKNTISFARAAIKQYEVDHREELDDAGIVAILSKQVKMRKDALADFEKAGRTDLAESYQAEIDILKRYLPEQLSADTRRPTRRFHRYRWHARECPPKGGYRVCRWRVRWQD